MRHLIGGGAKSSTVFSRLNAGGVYFKLRNVDPAFIRGPGVYLRSPRLFEMGILNLDYVS